MTDFDNKLSKKQPSIFRPNGIRATLHAHLRVLIIDDNEQDIEILKRYLLRVDYTQYTVDHAISLERAEELILMHDYDVALLDYNMGNQQGLALFGMLGSKEIDFPIILVSQQNSIDVDQQAIYAGCIDYLPKSELSASNLERAIRYAVNNNFIFSKLMHLAHHDALTGLWGRSVLVDRIDQAIALAGRIEVRWALLYIDLDNFKIINDQYGHKVGDALLVEFSDRLTSIVRSSDTAARLGGDEFCILLASVDETHAQQIADHLLQHCTEPMVIEQQTLELTCSVGVVCFPDVKHEAELTAEVLLNLADSAMYRVKEAGKNGSYLL
ncbi:GGDEF domain-containing response regulator [Oceanicoccus sp. KOV_DT_Chl]|uniref:two-component system response regulator n=1 Tax=Oceanicoccus sp. KOV_DT_Chl TaxID=1904639 RepID=UPI000C7D96FE|nr:GGDEF domain-containing response regulator [Oceanicoccus sp. KOV_DT_Chl]